MFMKQKLYRFSIAFFFFGTTFVTITQGNDDVKTYCYADDDRPYWSFGTTTPYEPIFHRLATMEIPDSATCKPVYMTGLVRSGIRYYSNYNATRLKELQTQIVNNHEKEKRGFLQPADLKNLKEWTSQGSQKNSDDPAERGLRESFELGKRFAQTLKNLVANQSEKFRFQTCSSLAVRESAKSFIAGMFGDSAKVGMSQNNDLLRYIEDSDEFLKLGTADAERKKNHCANSGPMQALKKEVADRLGYNTATPLPEDAISLMYYACSFEFAWKINAKPAFCAAFTRSHLRLLEHCYYDVFGYYEWGYGSEYAVKMNNPVLVDLTSKLEVASKSESPQFNGEINFASGAALSHLVMKLGLFHDPEHLPIDKLPTGRQHPWSMTKICPFSGNVLAVLQKCENSEHKVSFYHNEQLVHIPGCSSKLCRLTEFLSKAIGDSVLSKL